VQREYNDSRWKFVLLLIVVVLGLLGMQWLTHERQLLPEVVHTLESDDLVTVTQQPWLTFTPTEGNLTGFIFYPGGRIAHQGYAPLMKAIASEGYLVVVPDMPLNIAVLRPNVADEIIAAHPEIERWVISGHSVGGAMAAQYTHTRSENIAGLAIWASYPPDKADLSGFEIPVTLIYGSRETRVTDSSVAERQHLLPEDTVYVRIEGGDHHQFGSYEINPDDHRATISPEAQHAQIIQATLELLTAVSNTR
jgi:pimeloyl-ACP methyl ester carboxylesterase